MRSNPIDLSRRAEPHELPEWMDEPCSYQDFRACLIDLAQVNTLTLAARPTLRFLEDLSHSSHVSESRPGAPDMPLRILDVGCGGGDMLRRIARWAQRRAVAVQLTGIDLNPYAARAAREFTTEDASITWLTGDAFSYTQPVDVVISSLFTHHLPETEITQFLVWMEMVAQRGWFVNDLIREPTPLYLFSVMAAIFGWHRFVRHDGPVSFRRAFREDDWQRMALAAQLPLRSLSLQRWTPGRLCVGRLR